jgi:undecaprenyl diphosphate synthase
MLLSIYEKLLELQISRHQVPCCVAIVLSVGDMDLEGLSVIGELLSWLDPLGVSQVVLYIDEEGPELKERITSAISFLPADICLHTEGGLSMLGAGGRMRVIISLGFGGKKEVVEAVKMLLSEVEKGTLKPEEIDEAQIEANLRFSQRPDLVIRAGGKRLSDFMIWQAAYSELYFTEVNWSSLRKVDILRAIRDYQKRERRFGK